MPEGDTVWLTAQRLHQALAGRPLTVSDFRVPQLATVDLRGRTVTEVLARGKHILARVDDDLTLHSHLRMDGSWYLSATNAPPPRRHSEHLVRALLGNDEWLATGYRVHDLRVVTRADEVGLVGHLGPDLLGPDWDAEEAERRIRAQPDRAIGLALLDQRNLAGLGNVYRNELCFLRGVLPTRPVAEVPDLPRMILLAKRTLEANKNRVDRITTGDRRDGRQDWVYGRAGRPCRRCGTPIQAGTLGDPVRPGRGATDRDIYWCPRCQT
jgi:endonuclease-8